MLLQIYTSICTLPRKNTSDLKNKISKQASYHGITENVTKGLKPPLKPHIISMKFDETFKFK